MRNLTYLNIHLDRLDRNLKKITERAGKAKLIPMIKANAYGHDLAIIARHLDQYSETELDTLGVACTNEAIFLKRIMKIKKRIFIFSDIDLENEADDLVSLGIIPVLNKMSDLFFFLSDERFKFFPLVLKFNTGMNRLGFDLGEKEAVLNLLRKKGRLEVTHLMSHFACSYLPGHSLTSKQEDNFNNLKSFFKAEGIEVEENSLFNSGALEQELPIGDQTHVRPGLMMYGPQSSFDKKRYWEAEMVSELVSEVINIRSLKQGDILGYGGYQLKEAATILTLPVGYGDGVITKYQNYHLPEKDLKFIGRVNMDLVCLSTGLEACNFKLGEKIKIWGEDSVQFQTLAKHLGMAPYQVLTMISKRITRVVV